MQQFNPKKVIGSRFTGGFVIEVDLSGGERLRVTLCQ